MMDLKYWVLEASDEDAELIATAREKAHQLDLNEVPSQNPQRVIYVRDEIRERWQRENLHITHIYGLKVEPL